MLKLGSYLLCHSSQEILLRLNLVLDKLDREEPDLL